MPKNSIPKEARLKFKSARELIKQRNISQARAELLGIELGSSFTLFHRLLAACAFIDKDYELSASHIEQALALDTEKQVLIADAIRIYKSKGDTERALQLFHSFNLEKSESSSELLRAALSMKALSKYPEAALALEKALRLAPENTRIRDQYGIMLAMTNRPSEALQQWQFSLKFNPNDNQALVCLGRLYLHQEEYLKAIESFKTVYDSSEDNKSGKKVNLIDAYIRNSSYSEARELLSTVEGMDSNPRFHYLWGALHYRCSDLSLAFASLSRCIVLGKERTHEVIDKINWPLNCPSDPELKTLIDSTIPILDSIFDPFNMLLNPSADFNNQAHSDYDFLPD